MPAAEDFVKLYTDGACSGNPGPGGWAFILEHPASGKVIERSGAETSTTNNRMEIEGALRGLQILKRPCRVEIVTDSLYLTKGINDWLPGWRANGYRRREGSRLKPLLNDDLWRAVDALLARHQVRVVHVRGHAGHPQNERCDQLAVAAYKALGVRPGGTIVTPSAGIEPIKPADGGRSPYAEPLQTTTMAERVMTAPAVPATLTPSRPPEEISRAVPEPAPSPVADNAGEPEAARPAIAKPRATRARKTAAAPVSPKPTLSARKSAKAAPGSITPAAAEPELPPAAPSQRKAPKKRATTARRKPTQMTQMEVEFPDAPADLRQPARWDPDDTVD